MRETGIVKADVSVIDTEKVKHSVTLIVEVFLERDKIDLIDQAQRHFYLLRSSAMLLRNGRIGFCTDHCCFFYERL